MWLVTTYSEAEPLGRLDGALGNNRQQHPTVDCC